MRDCPWEWMLIQPDEVRHLESGPGVGEYPGGSGLAVLNVAGDGDVSAVIARAKEVLRAVVGSAAGTWDPEEVRLRLPTWFIAGCAPEQSAEEAEAWLAWWRGLDVADRAKASRERPWSVADWLFWLDPDERQWHWWDAVVDDESSAKVFVEVAGWPAALGALEWLLRVAGATAVVTLGPYDD